MNCVKWIKFSVKKTKHTGNILEKWPEILEKSGNFVSPEKWEPCSTSITSKVTYISCLELHSLNQPPKRSSPLNHLTDNQIKHLSHKQLSTSNTEDLLQPKKYDLYHHYSSASKLFMFNYC